ncbi:MAG: ABC transporter permease [Desulfobacterales bacterium]|nr:ABC transporter permease [Desulfobacterales bacterium]
MTIRKFIAKRLIFIIPQFFLTTLIIFVIIQLVPGDPILAMIGLRPEATFITSKELIRLKTAYGFDQPVHMQYLRWLWRLFSGDWGFSYWVGNTVLKVITKRFVNTLMLMVPSFILALCIGIPIGIVSAVKQYSKLDNVVMGTTIFFWSLPNFWYGLILIILFAVILGWFPTSGMYPLGVDDPTLIDRIRHMVLPVIVQGTGVGAGFFARLIRGSMLEVLRQDYVVTARAKGLKERVVIYKHALRNALLPTITVIGLYVGWLFGGSAVVESVFAWPGIGSAVVQAALNRDYPLLMGISIIVTLATLFAVLVADVVYAYVDPRIRY